MIDHWLGRPRYSFAMGGSGPACSSDDERRPPLEVSSQRRSNPCWMVQTLALVEMLAHVVTRRAPAGK